PDPVPRGDRVPARVQRARGRGQLGRAHRERRAGLRGSRRHGRLCHRGRARALRGQSGPGRARRAPALGPAPLPRPLGLRHASGPMNLLQLLNLRHKLTLLNMLTSVVVLVLACGAFLGYELLTFKRTLTRDLATLGDVIGDNCTAALTFGDNDAAKGVLGSLRAERHVLSACVYGPDGRPFATFNRETGGGKAWPDRAKLDGFEASREWVSVFRPITLDHDVIGTVYIRSDLGEMDSRVKRYAWIVALVLLTSSGVAFA